jgi:hypothetical protein
VAAGEDEPEAVVGDAVLVELRLVRPLRVLVELCRDRRERRVEPRATTEPVDRLEPPGRDEPRARVRRQAFGRPLLQRRGERIVQRLLGEVEVPEEAD